MNTYEGLILLKPILDMDNSDAALKNVEKTIEKLKGKVLNRDKMGRKRLAYEIAKFKDSFVTALVFQLPPENMNELSRLLKLNEDVLRFVMIRREENFSLEMAGKPRRPLRPGFNGPGGPREGGFRGEREGGFRGEREGGFRGDRDGGGFRGDREGGFRGDRDREPRERAGRD